MPCHAGGSVACDDVKQLRLVYGVADNFILRDVIAKDILSWAFTRAGGLVQTRSALLLVDPNGRITRSIKAPEGHTLLAPGTASLRSIFLPQTPNCARSARKRIRKLRSSQKRSRKTW